MTTREELMSKLRAADVQDVQLAAADARLEDPDLSSADLLEFFSRMLDLLDGPEKS